MSNQLNNVVGIVDEDLANLIQAAIAPLSFSYADTDRDLELFAEVCVRIAFGDYISPELAPVEEEEVEVEEPLTLEEITSVNPDRGCYGCRIGKDTEVEDGFFIEELVTVWEWAGGDYDCVWYLDVPHLNLVKRTYTKLTFIPFHCFNDNLSSYFTNSGDNPVIWDQGQQAQDLRSAGGWSDVAWEYGLPANLDSYFNSLYWSIKSHEAFERRDRTESWLDLLQRQPLSDCGRLRKIFWSRIYGAKSLHPYTAKLEIVCGGGCYMTSKQVAALAEEFRRKGSWLLKKDT